MKEEQQKTKQEHRNHRAVGANALDQLWAYGAEIWEKARSSSVFPVKWIYGSFWLRKMSKLTNKERNERLLFALGRYTVVLHTVYSCSWPVFTVDVYYTREHG